MALKPRFPRVENRCIINLTSKNQWENHMWFKYHEGKRASVSVVFFFFWSVLAVVLSLVPHPGTRGRSSGCYILTQL